MSGNYAKQEIARRIRNRREKSLSNVKRYILHYLFDKGYIEDIVQHRDESMTWFRQWFKAIIHENNGKLIVFKEIHKYDLEWVLWQLT